MECRKGFCALVLRAGWAVVVALALVTLPGCVGGDARVTKVERGVNFARIRLGEVGRDPMASMAFNSQMEMGGDLRTYLASCMADDVEYPRYFMDRPQEAWCVVLRDGPGKDDITIEGYGEDLTTPLQTVTVTLGPPQRRE